MVATAWLIVALLILANALYVAAEFGAVGVRRSRVRRLAEDGHGLAGRLLPYIEAPAALNRYISASQIGITLSSLALGAYGELTFAHPLESILTARLSWEPATAEPAAAAIILIALTAGQLVIGELIPKSLALQYPTETALYTILPMQWSLAIYRPFTAVLDPTARLVLRPFGTADSAHRHIHSPDEIELLIAESRDGGLLEPDEHRRLHQALRLGLRSARDLMIPLDRVTRLAVDTSWDDVVRTVAAHPYSRIPVYRGSPDRIVGTLRVKDLAAQYADEGPVPLERLIRPMAGVREDLAADRVIALLRERRVHQGVVVDRAGRAMGIVTIQDVLNELLGSVKAS